METTTLFPVPPVDLRKVAPELFAGVTTHALATPADVDTILPALQAAPLLALDTETTGLDFKRDQLHGVSLATDSGQWYICDGGLPYFLPKLAEMGSDPAKTWVMHNGKFDLHFLVPYGFRPVNLVDTMVAQWLVDENMELGLKSLASTRLGIGMQGELPTYGDLQKILKRALGKKKMEEVTIFDFPPEVLAEYAARDARLTYDLWLKLRYDLEQEGLTQVFYEIEMPFLWLLWEMEENGMYVNQAGVAELEAELQAEQERLIAEWNRISEGVNPNSTPQLREFLFTKLKLPKQGTTASGALSVDDLSLSRLERLDKTGAVKTLRELRRVQKMIGTYVVFMREKPVDGRVYGSFNQTGTVTGRLSSSDPNLQNIPSHGGMGKKIRRLFGAPPGYVLVDIDYSQIELRTMASDANEQNFLKAFEEGLDPHQMTADLAKVERSVGKTLNFSWAYGAGPRKLADTIEKNGNPRPKEEDTRRWLDSFNEAYPTLVNWKTKIIQRARELGYIPTYGGRKRRLPDLNSPDKMLRSAAERQCVNSRIQGSCADMLKWAMLQLRPLMAWYGAKLVASVHDEVLFEVPEEVAEEFGHYAADVMASIKEQFNLRVPIKCEPAIGKTWADTH